MAAQTSPITSSTRNQTFQTASDFETEPNNSPDSNRDINFSLLSSFSKV